MENLTIEKDLDTCVSYVPKLRNSHAACGGGGGGQHLNSRGCVFRGSHLTDRPDRLQGLLTAPFEPCLAWSRVRVNAGILESYSYRPCMPHLWKRGCANNSRTNGNKQLNRN